MNIHRLSLPTTVLGLLFSIGAVGCDNNEMAPLPNEYVTLAYVVDPPGTSTLDKPLILPVQTSSTMCDRTTKSISITASAGLAAFTLNLKNTGTAPAQLALTANGNTKGTAEVIIKVPTFFDMDGTAMAPQTFDSTVSGNLFTCTLSLPSNDLFEKLEGKFSCSSPSSTSSKKLTVTDSEIHAVPCPTAVTM